MKDDEPVARGTIARRVVELWGEERATADAGVIESASQALARIGALRPNATSQLDGAGETGRD